MGTVYVSPQLIDRNPKQPRTHFNPQELQSLSESIRIHGIIQPLIVENGKKGRLTLIAGERRLRAATIAKLSRVPVIIRDGKASPHELQELALIENLHRADMNVVEQGIVFASMVAEGQSVAQIARRLKISRAHIDDCIMFSNADVEIQEMIIRRSIPVTAAVTRDLVKISDKSTRITVARIIAKRKMGAAQARKYIAKVLSQAAGRVAKKVLTTKTPALRYANMDDELDLADKKKWDALKQLGRTPSWSVVVQAAQRTCFEICELALSASRDTCGLCPVPGMVASMMAIAEKERVHGS